MQQKHIIAIIYTITLFLDRLDLTIVNITLPTIAHVFNVPITATDWLTMSFLLALAVSIPISDWLGNKFGHKNIYIISILLFGLGSTLCVLATSLNTLILLRFIQGIGGGMLIPVGMTLIYQSFDRSEYSSITSFTFLPSLIAPAIAPFLGGILLDSLGWRFVYVFSGPICICLALFAMIFLEKDKHRNGVPLDFIGFILISTLLINTFYTLSLITRSGLSVNVLQLSLLACILLVAFIFWERKQTFPLFDLIYFKNKTFIKANLLQLCFQICHFGAIFIIGMYLQIGVGLSASMAGLIMGMQAFGAMTTSRYSVRLFNLYGSKLPIVIGLLGICILSPWILMIKTSAAIIFGCLLFFIRGIFSGLCGTPIQTMSVMAFPTTKIGPVNSIFNACRQVSISLGIAISSLMISLGMKINGVSAISKASNNISHVFNLGIWFISFIAIIGVVIAQQISDVEEEEVKC